MCNPGVKLRQIYALKNQNTPFLRHFYAIMRGGRNAANSAKYLILEKCSSFWIVKDTIDIPSTGVKIQPRPGFSSIVSINKMLYDTPRMVLLLVLMTVDERNEVMSAGYVLGAEPRPIISCFARVGGPLASTRAEAASLLQLLLDVRQRYSNHVHLLIFVDCLVVLDIIRKWGRYHQ
jgi:hypothetical protein